MTNPLRLFTRERPDRRPWAFLLLRLVRYRARLETPVPHRPPYHRFPEAGPRDVPVLPVVDSLNGAFWSGARWRHPP